MFTWHVVVTQTALCDTHAFFFIQGRIQNNIREVGKMAILLYWRCGGAALLFNMAVNVLPPAANVLPPRYWG